MNPKPVVSMEDLSDLKFYEYVSLYKQSKDFDVVIIGGSYAGLSAAITLGRALRKVLILDKGDTYNANDIYSYNFITQDGNIASAIIAKAKEQVLRYKTVRFVKDKVETVINEHNKFTVETRRKERYSGKKILFATGVIDMMLNIPGFKECWGISVLYCPYCNGFEFTDTDIGIIANGETAFEMVKLLSNWSRHIILFTNEVSTLSKEQLKKIKEKNVLIVETEIVSLEHKKGHLKNVVLKDGNIHLINSIFCKLAFLQGTDVPQNQLDCELTGEGLIKTDVFQRTSVPGVFSAGDNCLISRAISVAAAAGTIAGMNINKELIEETFYL
ncbi:MAG: NAD(P)/FAD-dependent oxidoreductase [Ferruginibacter sp.]